MDAPNAAGSARKIAPDSIRPLPGLSCFRITLDDCTVIPA